MKKFSFTFEELEARKDNYYSGGRVAACKEVHDAWNEFTNLYNFKYGKSDFLALVDTHMKVILNNVQFRENK